MAKFKRASVRRRSSNQINKKAIVWASSAVAFIILLMTVLLIWDP
jgi:uncharacterized membrane protein YvbJ